MKLLRQLMLRVSVAAAALTSVLPGLALGGPFTPGNLVVYRVGTGVGGLTTAAQAVFLDEYTTSGALVQSIALPTTVSGSGNRAVTASGTGITEGYLTRSLDGQYLLATGYNAAPGTLGVAGTTSASVNRVVARIDFNGVIDSSTVFNAAFSAGNIRSAVSTNGTDLWVSGAGTSGTGGVWYTTLGSSSPTQVSTTVTNTRNINIFGGQLFTSSNAGTIRIATVGTGLPTTGGQTIANIGGDPNNQGSPFGYFFADLNPSIGFGGTGLDTLYVVDDGGGRGGGGPDDVLVKFTFDGSTWVRTGQINITDARGLTGVVSGSSVTLFGTTATEGVSTIFTITDASGYGGTLAGSITTLATAATNTVFRGIAFSPQVIPEPGSLALVGMVLAAGGANWWLRRRKGSGSKP